MQPTPKTRAAKPRLTEQIATELRDQIQRGELSPGERLPSEAKLIEAYGVSRTVIREAVSALKVEGILASRQGAGVFVQRTAIKEPMPEAPFSGSYEQLSDIIEVLELRMAVEIESAALACQRMTFAHQARLYEALKRMGAEVAEGHLGAEADYQFHLAIAEATNNPHYVEFLKFLGNKTIPRARVTRTAESPEAQQEYLEKLLEEHRLIFEAIVSRDPDNARHAMRSHLTQSLSRYHKLLS
nr:FadR/GntR family transcriptional regulator [Halomonas xinjiangensis]